MRILKLITALVLLLAFTFSFSACGDNAAATETTTETEEVIPHGEGKEYTSAYVCPMHCDGSGSETAGECPVCGMDYVAQVNHVKDGHNH